MPARQRPRFLCQGCGRQAAWKPGAVCSRCVKDNRRRDGDAVRARVLEQERRRLHPTDAERAADRARLTAIHERWLAKQPADHPWKRAA